MTTIDSRPLKIFIAIASYGTKNDKYLSRIIEEYLSMPFSIDIVVLSNISKHLNHDVQVIAGLPTKDPWSLPFGHKKIFSERINDYDLFIYSEDDILVTRENLEAFIHASTMLPKNEIVGLFRFEKGKDGVISYPDVHGNHHWDAKSVRTYGNYTFACFSNLHSACYVLNRIQLQQALKSGGFLVAPHKGEYDLLCTAATDPYTQCGLTKLLCLSHFNSFLVHHLPNKYAGSTLSLDALQFNQQVTEISRIATKTSAPTSLLNRNPKWKTSKYEKDYYEAPRRDLVDLISPNVQSVLSIGCGWGATEEELIQSGKKVVAIPLDSVISVCAQAKGIEIFSGDLKSALAKLPSEKYDCLLISNILHLVSDPSEMLTLVAPWLSDQAIVITTVPNIRKVRLLWRRLWRTEPQRDIGNYEKSGVHFTSQRKMRKWIKTAGLKEHRIFDAVQERWLHIHRNTLGLLTPFLPSEIIAIAQKYDKPR